MKKVIIDLQNITKKYDNDIVVDNLSLTIYENEFLTLLGPSGCGKTTTLRMIAGFETPDSGNVIIDNKIFNDLPPYARPLNTVFQSYALFSHLNVLDNISFGLRNRKNSYLLSFYGKDNILDSISSNLNIDKTKITQKQINHQLNENINKSALEALALVGLKGFESRKIFTLSGGQQQRVALARAIVNKPKILLLDEPLAALDLKLRQNMQYELKEMQRKLGITFIFVTHDQEEAMTMSDRIVVMKSGVIQQLGTPKKIYNEPINSYVATFIGQSNIVRGIYLSKDKVEFMGTTFDSVGYEFNDNELVDVVIRPEDFDVVDLDKAKVVGTVTNVMFKGVHNELSVNIKGMPFIVNTYENYEVGEEIGLKVDPYEIHLMKVLTNE